MKSIIYTLLIGLIVTNSTLAQYLPPAFQNQTVYMQVVSSSKFVIGGTDNYNIYVNPKWTGFDRQEFYLQSTSNNTWYKIRHKATNKYITIHTAKAGYSVYLENSGYAGNNDLQEFQFIAETATGRFKIHSHFKTGVYDLILEIAPNNTTNVGLRIGKNITTGNSEHQKFDLADLYPPVSPGSAIPTLADRFENRTVGFIAKLQQQPLQAATNGNINAATSFYSNFSKEYKLEYTDETGWYKIRHKPTGKYITVLTPINNGDVQLKYDTDYPDERQKFKFIVQLNDSTYKIHSKYSEAALGLYAFVLAMDAGNTAAPMHLEKNITLGTDQNQQFIIRRYLPSAAQFSSGAIISNGKILNKQFHISTKSGFALLEPKLIGNDTIVTWQDVPNYGSSGDWVFDYCTDSVYVRIRYSKTGQYLRINTPTENAEPNDGTALILKSRKETDTVSDKRERFRVITSQVYGSIDHWFQFRSAVGSVNTTVALNDDGILIMTKTPPFIESHDDLQYFAINLVVPYDRTKSYSIVGNNSGHFISDSGVVSAVGPMVHVAMFDYASSWNFIPSIDGYLYIKNRLSGQFLSCNGSTVAGEELKSVSDSTKIGCKWQLQRYNSVFRIINVYSGLFIGTKNQTDSQKPLYQSTLGAAGTLWVIQRNDYFESKAIGGVAFAGLLTGTPASTNAENDFDYRDKVLRNLGFPFDPNSLQILIPPYASQIVSSEGISTSPYPDFYEVLKTALVYRFKWNTATKNLAMKNYKLDSVGHRTQAAFALRSFIIDSLAKTPRANWSYDERELVSWLERRMKSIRVDYAKRLVTSWEKFQVGSSPGSNNDLSLFDLWFPPIGTEGFQDPPYYLSTEAQKNSFAEFATSCAAYNYKNPKLVAALAAPPAVAAPAAIAMELAIFNGWQAAATSVHAGMEAAAITNAAANAAEATIDASLLAERVLMKTLGTMCTAEAVSAVITVALIAAEVIAMRAVEVDRFVKFDRAIYAKSDRILAQNVKVDSIMQGNKLLEKIALWQDLDILLAGGQRFDGLFDNNFHFFTGSGDWNSSYNWSNTKVPDNPLPAGQQVFIDHIAGGQCNITSPVTISTGAKLTVKPTKKLVVRSQLIVPSVTSY